MVHPQRSNNKNFSFEEIGIDLGAPLAEEDDFTPPIFEDDHPVVKLFLAYFPAISQLPNIPILNQTRAYRVIEEHVDGIAIAVIVSSIGLTAIAGIGVFFMSAGIVKLLFFSIQCGSGFIAIISTGGYAKKYFLLRRIQREVDVLRSYKEHTQQQIIALGGKNKEFQATIVDLQEQCTTLAENNVLFTAANATLQGSLETAENLCATLREHKEREEQECQALLRQQNETIEALQASLKGANQNLDRIITERIKLEGINTSLLNNVKASQDEFKKFKNVQTDLCKYFTKLIKFNAEFQQEKLEQKKFQEENRKLKEQLKSEVEKLELLRQLINFNTNELTKIQETLAKTEQNLKKRNEELEENNRKLIKITDRLENAVKRIVAPSSVNNQKE